MAIDINITPVIKGKSADELMKKIVKNDSRKGSIDFSEQVKKAKKILASQA